MGNRIGRAATAAVLLLLAGGCTVMESTYVRKVQEAEGLAGDLAGLRRKHQELTVGNDLLKSRLENQRLELANTIMERDRIKGDLAYVTGARDKAAADNKELEALLQARSDTLSQSLGDLRRKVADLEADNGRLRQESSSLRAAQEENARQLAELRSANEKLRADLAAQTKAGQEKVEKVSATYEGLLEKMKGEIAKGEVTISELKGKLTLNMVDSILFDSGKAEVKSGGAAVLEKVVSILRDVRDKAIRIEGHTDNVQIGGVLARQFPTNWELSAARAINVTRTLEKQGVDAASLAAVAYGETRPIAVNDTPEGRAKNRRIEIVLVAKD